MFLIIAQELQTGKLRAVIASRDDTILFYLFLFCFVVLALLRMRYSEELEILWKSFRNAVLAKRYHSQKLFQFNFPLMVLLAVAALVFALLAYNYFRFSPFEVDFISENFLLLFFILASIGLLALRFLLYALSTLFLPDGDQIFFYLKNIMVFTAFLALAISPLVLLLSFNPDIPKNYLFGAIGLVACIFIGMRLFRGLEIARPYLNNHKLYFFIYFCTLEIFPLLIFLRFTGIIKI